MIPSPARQSLRRAGHARVGRAPVARGVAWATIAALLLTVDIRPAEADTAVGSFTIRTSVYSGCTLSTADLVIFVGHGQLLPSTGSTTFRVVCGGATVSHPLPVRFTFTPADGGAFILKESNPSKQMLYELCNDSACTQVYVPGVQGPVVPVTSPAFSYDLFGRVYPQPGGASPGRYKQQVNVTLTY